MLFTREYPGPNRDLLYPLMVIAAIAVIVFSIIGIASITGWMPHAMVGATTAIAAEPSGISVEPRGTPDVPRAAPAFQCAECGVVESVREIERRGSLWSGPFFAESPSTFAAAGI